MAILGAHYKFQAANIARFGDMVSPKRAMLAA